MPAFSLSSCVFNAGMFSHIIYSCTSADNGRPISDYWYISDAPQRCINEKIHLLIEGSLNILYDFCVVLLPIPIVLRLNLPLRQRVMIAMLFGAGFIVCIAGIMRTYYMYRMTDGYRDVTWDSYPVALSTAIELYIGIVSFFLLPHQKGDQIID